MAGRTLRRGFSSRASWGSGVPARCFKRFLPLFFLFFPGPPGLEAASPAAKAPSLEKLIHGARNLLVARLVRRYPRNAQLAYRGHRGYYSTAGLELEVKAVFLGNAVTGDRLQVAYLKAVESGKHGFKPGQDYLLVFREATPVFLDVTPWQQEDGAFAVRGGYTPKATELDLSSAFWVGVLEQKISRPDFNGLIQSRLAELQAELMKNPAGAAE